MKKISRYAAPSFGLSRGGLIGVLIFIVLLLAPLGSAMAIPTEDVNLLVNGLEVTLSKTDISLTWTGKLSASAEVKIENKEMKQAICYFNDVRYVFEPHTKTVFEVKVVISACGIVYEIEQTDYVVFRGMSDTLDQSNFPAIPEGEYACITIGNNHSAFISGMKVSDGKISENGSRYTISGGDSEVEVITYKTTERNPSLLDIVEVEVRNLIKKIVRFKAGGELATKVK